MKVTKTKNVATYKGHKLEIGRATWNDKETSIRNRYPTKTGGFSPHSSSEIPLADVREIVLFAADQDSLKPKEIAEMIASLSASLSRKL